MGQRARTWSVVLAVLISFGLAVIAGCSSGSRDRPPPAAAPPPPPPPPPGVPTLDFALVAMTGSHTYPIVGPDAPDPYVVGTAFTLTATNNTVAINSITVTAQGATSIDETLFGGATIVEDSNGDGIAQPSEVATPVATTAAGFTTDNGTVTFTFSTPLSIQAGTPRSFFVVLDSSQANAPNFFPPGNPSTAIVGSTVDIVVASTNDIDSVDPNNGNAAIQTGGTSFGQQYQNAGATLGPPSIGINSHVLISEVCDRNGTGATSREFIEIYNPSGATFNLTNYHLTDCDRQSGNALGTSPPNYEYWQLSNAGATALFAPVNTDATSDFHARFPANTLIAPGEAIVIAIDGGGFAAAAYPGIPAGTQILALRNVQPGQTGMLTWGGPVGAFNFQDAATNGVHNNVGLTDGAGTATNGEGIILYFWNGSANPFTNLITDVDYVFYGTPGTGTTAVNQRIDKSGVTVATETFANDTPLRGTADFPNATNPSVIRIDFTEGGEDKNGTGNGPAGDNEMSEDLDNTWQRVVGNPTPGRVP